MNFALILFVLCVATGILWGLDKAVFAKQRFNAARSIYPPYGGRLQRLIYRFLLR